MVSSGWLNMSSSVKEWSSPELSVCTGPCLVRLWQVWILTHQWLFKSRVLSSLYLVDVLKRPSLSLIRGPEFSAEILGIWRSSSKTCITHEALRKQIISLKGVLIRVNISSIFSPQDSVESEQCLSVFECPNSFKCCWFMNVTFRESAATCEVFLWKRSVFLLSWDSCVKRINLDDYFWMNIWWRWKTVWFSSPVSKRTEWWSCLKD